MSTRQCDQESKTSSRTVDYLTPYNAIIRDSYIMGIPRYFIERWVPILGTPAATLVNTARQLSFRSEGFITISGHMLAREASMSRRHLYTCLQVPWLSVFLSLQSGARIRDDSGRVLQQANSYTVRMDDPLTPADAHQLSIILQSLAPTPIEAVQQALLIPPRELWASTPRIVPDDFSDPQAYSVEAVLQKAFPNWRPSPESQLLIAELAATLHRHITLVNETGRTSKIIVPHYFRTHWWPKLGHDLAWIYLWLRGHVYSDLESVVQRNTCWIKSLNVLLDVIGRTREWWRRNVENPSSTNETWQLSDFFSQIDSQKGKDPANPQWVARQFRVAIAIPIAPEDRSRYETLVNNCAENLSGEYSPEHSDDDTEFSPPRMLQKYQSVHHTPSPDVRHNQAHWRPACPPQPSTLASSMSATTKHTALPQLCTENLSQRIRTLKKLQHLSPPASIKIQARFPTGKVVVIWQTK